MQIAIDQDRQILYTRSQAGVIAVCCALLHACLQLFIFPFDSKIWGKHVGGPIVVCLPLLFALFCMQSSLVLEAL